MEIDNKNSEEKEVKQPAEIPEKEKDHVLRTAVILATVIIVLGGIVVAVRLNNPKQDTTKGRKILSEMDRTDVGKVNKKIQKLEEEERVKEEAADNRSVSEKFADCLEIRSHRAYMSTECWMRRMYRQTAERKFRKSAVKRLWNI